MKSIKDTIQTEVIINKSRFLNFLYPVEDVDDVDQKLRLLRSNYPDANHHCYAYMIGDHQEIQKYSDDGEPSKTAGYPMMDVLQKNDLTNVLMVSVRYFGGIKLGAGGLVRAYSKAASTCILEADFSFKTSFIKLSLHIPFDHIGHIEKWVRDHYKLLHTSYDTLVHYELEILGDLFSEFQTQAIEKTSGSAQIEILEEYSKYQ